jgi:chromosomal replication initiator protein
MDNQQLWQAITGELELSLTKANFNTWFKDTFIIDQENKSIIVGVPNAFTKSWHENKYKEKIVEILKKITNGDLIDVIFQVKTKNNENNGNTINLKKTIQTTNEEKAEEEQFHSEKNRFGLNPKYTFDSFVISKNNELAVAASKAIVKNPGTSYNPLFIYGNAGLGKTHLIQAIGHELLKKNQNLKIVYVTSEKFTNEFIYALKNNKINLFQQKYRQSDLLIVDDIQFIATKEQTQEQFFHTFNELHQRDKQIIITSDRPPKAINIEQRLQSRFEWGMIADISEPDFETRVAILEQKIKDKNFFLNQDVIIYLAENIKNNVRELEGALNRIIAHVQLKNVEPTKETVKEILQSINTITPKSSITTKKIVEVVAEFYNISLADITGKSRKKELVVPRQIAMYIMRDELKASYPNIGQELGGRDHTTAMHACDKINKEFDVNEKIKQDIALLKQKLYS